MTRAAEPSASPSAASPAEGSDPWIGRVLAGRYRVDARLGTGGMGAVYRGQHLALDRPVAIKLLHARLTEDPVVARRFDREALAASRLDHPGCVQMLDAGTTEDGAKFLVMQLLSGRELWSVQDGPLPPERAVELTLQILRALEHAHRRGLVHRDLKPENVIVTRDDDDREVVKILDFGIVKLLSGDEGDDKLTRAGMVFGTPRYMSPEQAAGGKVDARADLYTVGVLLYEMLAGRPPFSGDDMGIVLRMHILADPPPLPEHVPRPIADVILRLLQKRAVDRFATAKEVHDALQAALTTPHPIVSTALPPSGVDHTVLAVPAPPPTQTGAGRHGGMLGSIVALLVLALGLVIGWALLSPSGDRAPRIDIARPPLQERAAELPVGAAAGSAEAAPAEASGDPADVADPDDAAPRTEARRDEPRRDDGPPVAKPSKRDREARKKREEQEREARKRREEQEREARKRREEKGRKGRGRHDAKSRDH